MYELIPQLGQKLMQAIGPQCRFVQQYDPFTGEPSVICEPGQPPQDAYGPAMLSVLEYTARMYGVSLVRDTVVWGTCPLECRYTQALNGRSWEIVNSGHEAEAFVDGRKVFTAGPGPVSYTHLRAGAQVCHVPFTVLRFHKGTVAAFLDGGQIILIRSQQRVVRHCLCLLYTSRCV